jgi:hypothetical protein
VKTLTADVASLETAKDHAFTPPPQAWIAGRVAKLNEVLTERTEKSALALRRLTGAVTLTLEKPEVGRPVLPGGLHLRELEPPDRGQRVEGSNLLQWWSRRESNPRPRGFQRTFVHVRSRITRATGLVDSATT